MMVGSMELIIFLLVIGYSVILHEIAHGYVANRLGDPTARYAGRLTLNPLPHIDPVMTILLPIASYLLAGLPFGAAKPVPVNPLNLRDGRKDMALVALAGPLTNFAIALILVGLYKLTYIDILIAPITLNIWLGILNLVPIPPIDGSKFIASFLPSHIAYQYESIGQYGIFILILLLYMPIGGFSLAGLLSTLLHSALLTLGIS